MKEIEIGKLTLSEDEINILRLFLLMEEDFITLPIKKIVAMCCVSGKMPQTGRAVYTKYGEIIGVLRFAAQKVFAVLDLPPPEYDAFICEHEELKGVVFLAAVVREKLERFLSFRPLPLMLRREFKGIAL